MYKGRFTRLITGLIAGSALALTAGASQAQGVLRIGMTASDIPLTTGQPDNGGEGQRFLGYTVYDALINWDLSSSTKPSGLAPGLATAWKVDDKEHKHWTFTLRKGVKFHDGSEFTAEAVVWNLDKLLKKDAPQFDSKQAAQGSSRIPAVATYKVIDPYTVEISTKDPDAFLPFQLAWIPMSSPAQWEKLGKSWEAFAKTPSGTGPWKLISWTPRERAEMVPNKEYWDKARVPKLDKLVLIPLPEANTRVAALRSGQVDWIEAPPPDAVASLKAAKFQIVTNAYPHNWVWHLSRVEGSPFNDIRVRRAANLAVDRNGLNQLLGGLSIPATGFVPPGSAWFGKPTEHKFDLASARKLMAEAGYTKAKPLTIKVLIPSSGSGMMQPLPMNEFVQQNLNEAGFKVEFEVLEWNALISAWRAGAKDPLSRGAVALNYSYFIQDPFTAFTRHVQSELTSPKGTNWGYYKEPAMDALLLKAKTTFESDAQLKVLQEIHEKFVNDALFLDITHDVNPRAMSPKVHGFVQAKNWFQDFSPIFVK